MISSGKKLSANSRPVRLLRQWLASGKLAGDESPAAVQAMSPVLAGYKLDNFRRAYNKLRKENGPLNDPPSCTDGMDNMELKRRCSADLDEPSTKKGRLESIIEDDDDDESETESVVESRTDLITFKPFYMLSSWEERHTTTKRLSVEICLPTGVDCNDYPVRVLSGGLNLEMRCMWPEEFCNIERLHRKWLESDDRKLESYHSKMSGFDNF